MAYSKANYKGDKRYKSKLVRTTLQISPELFKRMYASLDGESRAQYINRLIKEDLDRKKND